MGADHKVGFFEWDLVNNMVHWDHACYHIFGIDREVDPTVGLRMRVSQPQLDALRATFSNSVSKGQRCQATLEISLSKGSTKSLALFAWIKHSADGRPRHAIGAYIEQELALIQEQDPTLREIAQNIPGFLYKFRLHPDGKEEFCYVGEQCEAITGSRPAEVVADPHAFWDLIDATHRESLTRKRDRSMQTGEPLSLIFPIVHRHTSQVRWLQAQSVPHQDHDGSVTWDGLMIDATDQKSMETQMESQGLLVRQQLAEIANKNKELELRQSELANAYQQMRVLAQTDSLTGVSNRHAFQQNLQKLSFFPGARTHLLLVDIDEFRELNNSIGHQNGDEVLKLIARRISSHTGWRDKVARLNGDVFALSISIEESALIEDVCRQLAQSVSEPIQIDSLNCQLTCSIGAALIEKITAVDDDTAMLRADLALQVAKESGRDQIVVYSDELGREFEHRLAIERDLNHALANGEMFLVYQPIVQMETGRLAGFEALCRWEHPERGLVSPADFIPLAERTGLIVPLGQWVMMQATKQVQQWREEFGLSEEFITVNVSGSQLAREDFEGVVYEALDASGMAATHLKLEVTETVMVSSSGTSVSALRRLRERGIRVALDDFGTGFSSIGALQSLPIDTIKLDRSFVKLAGDLNEDSSIIQAILSIAKAMKADVVAEGIESKEQAAHLRMLGCELAQGFFFSRPLSVPQVEALLESKNLEFGQAQAA